MNKRLKREFGEHVAEKRGWHWVLLRQLLAFAQVVGVLLCTKKAGSSELKKGAC
jgi:hypothetical protein